MLILIEEGFQNSRQDVTVNGAAADGAIFL